MNTTSLFSHVFNKRAAFFLSGFVALAPSVSDAVEKKATSARHDGSPFPSGETGSTGRTKNVFDDSSADMNVGGVPYETRPSPRFQTRSSGGSLVQRIDLSVGKSIVIDLPREASEIFVGDQKIANAIVRTTRQVFVVGVGSGATSIFVSDKNGAQILALEVDVVKEMGRDLAVLREIMHRALPRADIQVNSVGDNFVISGSVESALEAQTAMDIAKNVMGKSDGGDAGGGAGDSKKANIINTLSIRGRDQVMLKVTVAEIQRSALKQLGINFDGSWRVGDLASGSSFLKAATELPLSVQGALSSTGVQATLAGKLLNIKTLERQGVARTLAEPTLTAISGESAKFMAGGEISVPTSESCSAETGVLRCTASLTYKPVGVSLNFTPVVLSENRISIRLSTEVTEVDPSASSTLQQTTVPGFRTRKAETTVELPSGGILATAGLIQQQSRHQINGVPGLMNIPILGTLFRSRDYQRYETELLILVQPVIAKPSNPGQIFRPDEGFADASDPESILAGKLNRTYGVTLGRQNSTKSVDPVGFINY